MGRIESKNNKAFEWILKEFDALTAQTAPHPHDKDIFKDFLKASGRDKWAWIDHEGGMYLDVGDSPSTMFLAHLDTVGKEPEPVLRLFDENTGLLFTDGKTILGADDRAGIVLLLWLIEHKVEGRYVFPVGEEVGMVGSTIMRRDEKIYTGIKRAIQFDRRGYGSIITHQMGERTCSEAFALALATELNYSMPIIDETKGFAPDSTGSYTDSKRFSDVVPECTNISVGYFNEHTTYEEVDMYYLSDLALAVVGVDWNSLPTERDPSKREYNSWGFGSPTLSAKPAYDKSEEEFYSWLVSQDKNLVADTLDLKDGYVLGFIQWLIDTNHALEDELEYVWFLEKNGGR